MKTNFLIRSKLKLIIIVVIILIVGIYILSSKVSPVETPTRNMSNSEWPTPSDPIVLKPNPRTVGESEFLVLTNRTADYEWDQNSIKKEAFDELKLQQKYYDFFYKEGRFPIRSGKSDLNKDNKADDYFMTVDVGSINNHSTYIYIFINDNWYVTTSDNGGLEPKKDHNGFIIYSFLYEPGKNYRTSGSTESNFEWDGIGFKEIGRRQTIKATPNPTSEFLESTRDWKTLNINYPPDWVENKSRSKKITLKYPSFLSYKEEHAKGTLDLGIFFINHDNKTVIAFTYSDNDFKEGFYDPQKSYLGELQPVNLQKRQGYKFTNKYGYNEGFYFPLENNYYSIQLYDTNYKNTLEEILATITIH